MAMSERAVGVEVIRRPGDSVLRAHPGGRDDPDALDFTFGNPHEMALPGLTDAMRAQLEPRSVDWYAYKTNERPRRRRWRRGSAANSDSTSSRRTSR